MGVRSGGAGWVDGAREWARQMCRRRSGASTRGSQVAWRHAWPWRRCATWWRDGPDAARACCAWRACVREAAHVRLGATMAIELAEKRNAIVCVGVVAWKVKDGWDRGKCPDASSRHFRKCLFLAVFADGVYTARSAAMPPLAPLVHTSAGEWGAGGHLLLCLGLRTIALH